MAMLVSAPRKQKILKAAAGLPQLRCRERIFLTGRRGESRVGFKLLAMKERHSPNKLLGPQKNDVL